MKIFQILNGICYYDATPVHPTLESTVGIYTPDIVFTEAPDYVFEGWGYDDTKTGDERFIQPTPPDGWRYDPATGSFIPINPIVEETEPSNSEKIAILQSQVAALTQQNEMLEDCIVEMAGIVYA